MTANCPRCGTMITNPTHPCAGCGHTLPGMPMVSPTMVAPTPGAPYGVQAWPHASVPPSASQPMVQPQSVGYGTGQGAWPPVPVAPPSVTLPPATPTETRSHWPMLVAGVLTGLALASIGAAYFYVQHHHTEHDHEHDHDSKQNHGTAPGPTAAPPAPHTAASAQTAVQGTEASPQQVAQPPASMPTVGMPTVHYPEGVPGMNAAQGLPDRRYAVVRAGLLTLQMNEGHHLVSDGTPAPDLRVEVDPAMPGPYRVEVGIGHERDQFVIVADGVTGSAAIDLDQTLVRAGRFVRLSTRASGAAVGVDAVLVRVASPVAQAPR